MKQRISIALAVVLFASALFATSVALADGHRGVATPHAIALRLEPPYVTVGSTAKIIATFTPGVDVESLLVSIWLPPEVRTDPDSAWINRWREKARKGEAIVVSTAAIFPKPGRYPVGVSYWHADTHGPWVLRANTIGFYILVPGGIETVKPKEELPYRSRAPKGVQNMPGGEPLFCFPIKTKMNSASDSMVSRHPEKVGNDSIVTAFETLPSAGSKETATIVIAEGNSLVQQPEGREPVVYSAGDTIVVEWDSGDCYLNGRIYQSRRPSPPKNFPVTQLKQMYGKVPSVLDYVRTHHGDETVVWNEADRQWEKKKGVLTREVARRYMSALENGKTVDEAAAGALSTLRANSLVDSAWLSERPRPPRSQTSIIFVKWAGMWVNEILTLRPSMRLDWTQQAGMTLDTFRGFVSMLKTLERKGPVRIELRGGGVVHMWGKEAAKRSGKS